MDANGVRLPDPDSELPIGDDPIGEWVKIVKERSDDGMFTVNPDSVGSRIFVNLRSVTMGYFYNKELKKHHGREIIYKVLNRLDDPHEIAEWIPTELLEFPPSSIHLKRLRRETEEESEG